MLPLTLEAAAGSSAPLDSCSLLSKFEGVMEIKVPDMPAVIPILAGMVAPGVR